MKNKLSKHLGKLALSLMALLAVSCGNNGGANQGDAKTIQIYVWDSGLGTSWLEKDVADFNASQTDYVAKLSSSTNAATIIKTLGLSESNPYDLYFTMLNTFQYNSNFANLDDVINSTVTGESKKIGDKFYDGYLDATADASGAHSMLSYGQTMVGIIYNRSLVKDSDVPNTTDELEGLVSDLSGNGVTPWLFYNQAGYGNGYWTYVTNAWEAQYNGLDYHYNNLMQLKDASGVTPSKDIMLAKDGRYKSLEVMESILTPNTVHKQCTNQNFTTVQNLFLNGESALTINGSWLLSENSSTADINMMKTPVISSIVEKLEDTAMSDATLSSIISEIDNGATSSAKCSTKDFARIKEARNIMACNSAEQYVFAPTYSNCLDGSKQFLKFFYSDSGIVNYMKTLNLPDNARLDDTSLYSEDGLSTWNSTQFKLTNSSNLLMNRYNRQKIFQIGYNSLANINTAQAFIASNPKDRETADGVWGEFESRVKENWDTWVQ